MDSCAHAQESPRPPPRGSAQPGSGGYDAARWDLAPLLDRLVTDAVGLVGVDAVGLLVADGPGPLAMVAASDRRTMLIQQLQLDTRDGPGLQCHHDGASVVLPDLGRVGLRWARFAQAARLAGFASAHMVPMRARYETIGALSLFASQAGHLSRSSTQLAEMLTDVVTLAILQRHIIDGAAELNRQLQEGLNSRVVIEQAKGVLAQRYAVSIDTAFGLLRRHARGHNYRLVVLADAVVHGSDDLPH